MSLFAPQSDLPYRSGLRKRFAMLLLAGLAAFSLTTWRLARVEMPVGEAEDGSAPAGVVEAQLDALAGREIRAAYDLFSARYRKEVSFEMFHDLIVSHLEMFETQELTFRRREETGDRAVVETHTESEEGGHYVARFTLVRISGRWWIDEVRWGEENEGAELIQA